MVRVIMVMSMVMEMTMDTDKYNGLIINNSGADDTSAPLLFIIR